jgi:hypothetical protein
MKVGDERLDKTTLYDKRSILEMESIINFCSQLVIKDEDKASATETMKSMKTSYQLINAMLRADTLDDYEVTLLDLQAMDTDEVKYSTFNPKRIPDAYKDEVLEYERYKVYKSYISAGDMNSYYEDIYQTYFKDSETHYKTFESFKESSSLPFYVTARLYKNFSLIWYPDNILTTYEVIKFKKCYNECLNYFMAVCYNEAYKINNNKYNDLCKLMIIFMTIKRYLNSRLENIDDIDFFDEYSIRNLFLSYGLDYFFDMPLKYQKRVLKNLNFLIKNKGTNKALINILEIFGFDNIKVMRYILCKEYSKDPNTGYINIDDPVLKFYELSDDYDHIEEAIQNSNSYDYDDFVSSDKYWQLTDDEKKQLYSQGFNYVNTKYISISSMMSLTEYGNDFTYFIDLIYRIELKKKDDTSNFDSIQNLYFYDYLISTDKITLFHAIFLLFTLVLNKFGYDDLIIHSSTANAKVYGFNFDDITECINFYKESRKYKTYDEVMLANGYTDVNNDGYLAGRQEDMNSQNCEYLTPETINAFKKKNLKYIDDVINEENEIGFDNMALADLFKSNVNFRKELEELILATKNKKLYNKYMVFYKCCFVSDFRNDIFDGYETYTDYFKKNDEALYTFLMNLKAELGNASDGDKELLYNQYILDLCTSIETYLDDDTFDFIVQGNTYLMDYIREFVYQLINFIKSYTVQLKEMTTIYVFDEKFRNIILYFDDAYMEDEMNVSSLLYINEKMYSENEDSKLDGLELDTNVYIGETTYEGIYEPLDLEEDIHTHINDFTSDLVYITDDVTKITDRDFHLDELGLKEYLIPKYDFLIKDDIQFKDKLSHILNESDVNDNLHLMDDIEIRNSHDVVDYSLDFTDGIVYNRTLEENSLLFSDLDNLCLIFEDIHIKKYDLRMILHNPDISLSNITSGELVQIESFGTPLYYTSNKGDRYNDFTFRDNILIIGKENKSKYGLNSVVFDEFVIKINK